MTKENKSDGKLLNYFKKSKFKFFGSTMNFLSSTYSLTLRADFCVGNHSINNSTDYERTRRKQSLITWGCADIYKARKTNMQFWMAPMVFLSSYMRGKKKKWRGNQNKNQTLF